jgi:minor histocompatibility antigen H13
MAMALRVDLYLHYMRKQKRTSVNKENPSNKNETGKVPYIEATGVWGERYWTAASSNASTAADGARFSKVYFKASIVGYIIAMLVTMAVMHHFKHGQPALLYLVPGVLGALWGTAWVRGELTLMWEYSEDGEWGFEDEKKAIETKEDQIEALASGKGNALKSVKAFTAGFGGNGMESSGDKSSNSDDKDLGSNRGCADAKRYKDEEHAHHVFLVSLTTAPQKKEKREKVL